MRSASEISLIFMAIVLFALTWQFPNSPSGEGSKKFLAPPPDDLEYFHFGFRESMADSLWLRWIQDSDYCQTYSDGKNEDIGDKTGDINVPIDNLTYVPRYKICNQSWGFKMLDSISKLAPRFKMIYLAGAPTLSILVEDYTGSSVIYDRGIKEYPNDWMILYRASYHFQYDVHDIVKAAELLNRAGDNGAPIWLKSLAARLYTLNGQIELGLSTLESYRKTIDPENVGALKKVDERIAELKRKLQP
jgi:hypothetical protein